MAYFHISPGTPSLNLPSSRQGQFSFTVSNNLGRSARIQASVVPEGGTKPEWLSVQGEAERSLGQTETQTFIVQVQVPQGVPVGEQRFRLLVATVAKPDDEYDTSPAVAFTIPAAVEGKPFPWWIVIVGAAVVVIGVGGFFLFRALSGPKVPPPGAACTADANCPATQKCVVLKAGEGECQLRAGQPCKESSECASWCMPSKHQCAPDNGACAADADCPSANFKCVNTACKVQDGKPCLQHVDCVSLNCQANVCQPCTAKCPSFSQCVGNQCTPFAIPQRSLEQMKSLIQRQQHW